MCIYRKLGVTRVINCFGTYTLIGGSILSDEIREAMEEADRNFAWLWELEEKAGKRIAELTGAEAAFVTPGVFAALAMSAAACMAGRDQKKMSRLPDTSGMRNEFIIQRCLRDFKYDRSMTVAGGKLVEVGDEHRGCTPKEIEEAIGDRTAGIHYMAHSPTGDFASPDSSIVPLEQVIEIGHRHGVPVIVDAAFQCYPLDGFTRFAAIGADLVAYSCKYFGGPNTAGLLIGRKDLVDTVALHSFVGQEGGPGGEVFLEAEPDRPHGSVFRGYKMDRSSITGAVASLEGHLATDFEKTFRDAHLRIDRLKKAWEDIPDIEMEVYDVGSVEDEPGRISLHLIFSDKTAEETTEVVKALMDGDPAIWASSEGNHLVLNVTSFRGLPLFDDEDVGIIAETVRGALS